MTLPLLNPSHSEHILTQEVSSCPSTGTGKTDTAVQIMHVLYANNPGQRVLLITHSNQALNDLFGKLLQRDVPARYLLRLGMGEAELETEQDFSRVGRVNAMLARRLELLAQVGLCRTSVVNLLCNLHQPCQRRASPPPRAARPGVCKRAQAFL